MKRLQANQSQLQQQLKDSETRKETAVAQVYIHQHTFCTLYDCTINRVCVCVCVCRFHLCC